MRGVFLTFTVGFVLLQAIPTQVFAQNSKSQPGTRVPATIVLADRLPTETRFVVKRLPGAARSDVVVLATDATEADLDAAVRSLLTARQMEGDAPIEARTFRMRPSAATGTTRPRFPWIGRVLADLKRAERTDVEGLGPVRAVQIWLPAQKGSGRKPQGRRI